MILSTKKINNIFNFKKKVADKNIKTLAKNIITIQPIMQIGMLDII